MQARQQIILLCAIYRLVYKITDRPLRYFQAFHKSECVSHLRHPSISACFPPSANRRTLFLLIIKARDVVQIQPENEFSRNHHIYQKKYIAVLTCGPICIERKSTIPLSKIDRFDAAISLSSAIIPLPMNHLSNSEDETIPRTPPRLDGEALD